MLQPLAPIPILCPVKRRFIPELSCQRGNDHRRNIGRIVEEGAEIADRCQLNGESEPVVFFSPAVDQGPVMIIQVKVPGEFFRLG